MTSKLLTVLAMCFAMLASFGASARAQDDFVPLPTLSAKAPKELQVKIVKYDGSTNGEMVVDIRNASDHAVAFKAEGLYFVPAGDPERAPQRLGAAGPFMEVSRGKNGAYRQQTSIGAGQTKRLALDVFCIDSHRGSPSAGTKFSLAKSRMPEALRKDIHEEASDIIQKNGGSVAASKSEIQSATWKHRDKRWIRLEGERKNEKAPSLSPDLEREPLQNSRENFVE